jgi:sulfur carrier protein
MKVTLNGKERDVPDGITVQDLLDHLELHPRRIAVELNRSIVKRDRFGETAVQPDDSIEILQFVGGG